MDLRCDQSEKLLCRRAEKKKKERQGIFWSGADVWHSDFSLFALHLLYTTNLTFAFCSRLIVSSYQAPLVVFLRLCSGVTGRVLTHPERPRLKKNKKKKTGTNTREHS